MKIGRGLTEVKWAPSNQMDFENCKSFRSPEQPECKPMKLSVLVWYIEFRALPFKLQSNIACLCNSWIEYKSTNHSTNNQTTSDLLISNRIYIYCPFNDMSMLEVHKFGMKMPFVDTKPSQIYHEKKPFCSNAIPLVCQQQNQCIGSSRKNSSLQGRKIKLHKQIPFQFPQHRSQFPLLVTERVYFPRA